VAADPAFGSDFKDKVLANVVSKESNVRQTLAKVTLGEADAGIVYTTDTKSASEVGTIDIPEGSNVVARYFIAPLKSAQHPQTALGFIEYALSKEGQQTLVKYGFGPAEVNQ
jgi:molybdate transport system substrate-binding protein